MSKELHESMDELSDDQDDSNDITNIVSNHEKHQESDYNPLQPKFSRKSLGGGKEPSFESSNQNFELEYLYNPVKSNKNLTSFNKMIKECDFTKLSSKHTHYLFPYKNVHLNLFLVDADLQETLNQLSLIKKSVIGNGAVLDPRCKIKRKRPQSKSKTVRVRSSLISSAYPRSRGTRMHQNLYKNLEINNLFKNTLLSSFN